MLDLNTRLTTLTRPRLLARAARIGAEGYMRSRDLKRLLGSGFPRHQGAILMRLLDLESSLESARCASLPGYSFARHVDVLIALAAESRLYLQRPCPDQGSFVAGRV